MITQLRRLPGWEAALARYIEACRNRPFQWGIDDCGLFAAGDVLTLTGVDMAAEFRGKYDSALSARRILGDEGMDALPARMGLFQHAGTAFARRGDIVLVRNSREMPALGVCLGVHSAFVGAEGLEFCPTQICARAWRVG